MKTFAPLALVVLTGSSVAGIYSGPGFQIPENNPAGITSVITVTDDVTSMTALKVSLVGIQHTYLGDLIATLTSPQGVEFTLFSRVGSLVPDLGDSSNLLGTYTFSDYAVQSFWTAAGRGGDDYNIRGSEYRTTGPLSSQATNMNAAFEGLDSNGTWTLKISDNFAFDRGGMSRWELNIIPTPGSFAVLGFAGLAAGRRRRN